MIRIETDAAEQARQLLAMIALTVKRRASRFQSGPRRFGWEFIHTRYLAGRRGAGLYGKAPLHLSESTDAG
jgi:hypothetical protein